MRKFFLRPLQSGLETQQVGELHEELSGVIEEASGAATRKTHFSLQQVQISAVVVVAHVQGRPGIDQIGQKKVAVEIQSRLQARLVVIVSIIIGLVYTGDEPARR